MLRPFGVSCFWWGAYWEKRSSKRDTCPTSQGGSGLSSIWGSLVQSCGWPSVNLGLAHIFHLFPQLILLGAPPAADRGGASGGGYHIHYLHGTGGGQDLLNHHGVPLLQACLVPPWLHPGRRPFPHPRLVDVVRPAAVSCSHCYTLFRRDKLSRQG